MHLDDSELGRERRRTPRGGGAGGDNLIRGKKKFVHVEVGTLFTFLFLEGEGVCGARVCTGWPICFGKEIC